MEVYILDSLLRREQVIDRYESLIWTERFASWGDFELHVYSNFDNRQRFVTGTHLAMNRSNRVMRVETVENEIDEDGKSILKIQGRSLEAILLDRAAWNDATLDTTESPTWTITGTPSNVVVSMFNHICVTGAFNINDKIPFLQTGNMYPPDTIAAPAYEITHEQEPATLYDAIRELCLMYDLGFRLTRDYDSSKLYFNVYTGSDRTSAQSALPAVVFAPELDNLQNTTSLKSVEGAKNCAFVIDKAGSVMVYPDDVPPDVAGFDRRLLVVKTSIDTRKDSTDPLKPPLTAEQINSLLIQKGREELSKNRTLEAFDGEIDQSSNYKYDVNYYLGDMVEIRNADGEGNYMRVTEQIFVSDKEGERSYPTLTLNQYVNPGSWLAWDYNQVWLDLDTNPMTWAEA